MSTEPTGFHRGHLAELAEQDREPLPVAEDAPSALEATVRKYNAYVDAGQDEDFGKPAPKYKIQTPPFHAAWSTPILHDCLAASGSTANAKLSIFMARSIPAFMPAGESAGGFALHGLPGSLSSAASPAGKLPSPRPEKCC